MEQPSTEEWHCSPLVLRSKDRTCTAEKTVGLNASWNVSIFVYNKHNRIFPTVSILSTAKVVHSSLIVCAGFPRCARISIPLISITYIELSLNRKIDSSPESCEANLLDIPTEDGTKHSSAGVLSIRGRNFRVKMYIRGRNIIHLLQIRDWLRFLVVRQRIPNEIESVSIQHS
ncbi:hypothetical protein Ddc_06826 [Ditylenchus destructor]|nr:hypothetical protein Ddc_06826 [Ditylenchus destructor]